MESHRRRHDHGAERPGGVDHAGGRPLPSIAIRPFLHATLRRMTGVRWGFTFLIGTSLLKDEAKLDLVSKATLMYLNGDSRIEVSGDAFEGVLSTNREWKVIGAFSGQQFDAFLDSNADEGKLHLRFLVSEQTLRQGAAFSNN